MQDVLAVIAKGTSESRIPATNLLFHYWPLSKISTLLSQRRSIQYRICGNKLERIKIYPQFTLTNKNRNSHHLERIKPAIHIIFTSSWIYKIGFLGHNRPPPKKLLTIYKISWCPGCYFKLFDIFYWATNQLCAKFNFFRSQNSIFSIRWFIYSFTLKYTKMEKIGVKIQIFETKNKILELCLGTLEKIAIKLQK